MKKYAIGVDVGGSHLCSSVIDLETGALCTEPLVTPMDSMGPAEHIWDCFETNLKGTISAFDGEVRCIGLAFPGPFDYAKGICLIKDQPKFRNIYGMNVGDCVRSRLADLQFASELEFKFANDASAFALGESFAGAGKGFARMMAFTLGTGVGSGFVVNGRLEEDSQLVPPGGEVWCLPFENTIVDDSFSTRWIVRRYKELTGIEFTGAKDVCDRVETEASARQVYEEYGCRLAEFAAPLYQKFGADVLVLGGNIARGLPYFGPSMYEAFAGKGLDVTVKLSALLDKAAMLGAASLFA